MNEWKRPDMPPEETGFYLVTRKHGCVAGNIEDVALYDTKWECWFKHGEELFDVKGWAEYEKPPRWTLA